MASTTLLTLLQECGSACRWRLVDNPSATGTTTTFVFGSADSPVDEIDADTLYKNAWAYVEADSAVTPLNVGECRRIKSFTPSTATFTLATSRGFTNAPTTTQTIGVYRTVPPDAGGGVGERETWKSLINRTLRNLKYRRYYPLSLVTDADCESTATTDWTASNSTLSKVTTASTVSFGARALRVQNSSASGYVRSSLIPVAEGDTYDVRVDIKVASGTVTVQAYDETAGAEIESEETSYRDWRYVDFHFTIPADCHSMSIRLVGTQASADFYADNLAVWPSSAHRMPLPSWVTKPADVEGLYVYRGYSVQDDASMAASQLLTELPHYRVIEDTIGATQFLVEYRYRPRTGELLLVRGLSAYEELSAITSTTFAPKDLVVAGACLLAAQKLGDEQLAAEFGPKWRALSLQLPRRTVTIPGVW